MADPSPALAKTIHSRFNVRGVLAILGVSTLIDLIKEYLRGKLMDWSLSNLNSALHGVSTWLLLDTFSMLTIATLVVVLCLIYVALGSPVEAVDGDAPIVRIRAAIRPILGSRRRWNSIGIGFTLLVVVLISYGGHGYLVGRSATLTIVYITKSYDENLKGNFGNALEYANKAIALEPANARAWNDKAAAYISMSKWQDGMEAARRALKLDPTFQLAANNYGWAARHDQFYGLVPNNKNTNPNVAFDKDSLTLNELFIRDETLGGNQSCAVGPTPPAINGQNLVMAWCVVWNPSLNVKIIKLYIPEWPETYKVAEYFSGHYNDILALVRKLGLSAQPNSSSIAKWEEAPFNGTVFLYHESDIPPEQLGDLVKLYRSKKLILSFRDGAYLDRIIKRSTQ